MKDEEVPNQHDRSEGLKHPEAYKLIDAGVITRKVDYVDVCSIDTESLLKLLAERDQLRIQVGELQANGTRQVFTARDAAYEMAAKICDRLAQDASPSDPESPGHEESIFMEAADAIRRFAKTP